LPRLVPVLFGSYTMPVRELIRGLAGAFGAFVATLIMALCLAETRTRFGVTERGIWWLPGKSWSPHFSPIWHPLISLGAINMICGYLLAGKLTSKRNALFALVGAAVAPVLAELLAQSPLPKMYGKAGRNTIWFGDLLFALGGAYAGASIAEQTSPGKRRRKKKAKSDKHHI
jgi:hypothetical protein